MAYLKICPNFESCIAKERELQQIRQTDKALLDVLYCNDCVTYKMYNQGFKDGAISALTVKQADKYIEEMKESE